MDRYDVIIIGAGQAGLALGYFLQQAQKKFLLITKDAQAGEVWRLRYDSLTLFTTREYSQLPGLKLSGDRNGFPTKDEIAQYLLEYVEKFNLPIRFNTTVLSLAKDNGVYSVVTDKGKLEAKQIVVAAGPFQQPNVPSFSQNLSADVFQLHSSQYKNPAQLQDGPVLVAGGGNSGAQIAVELADEGQHVYFSTGHKLRFAPLTLLGRSVFWWLDRLGVLFADASSLHGRWLKKKGDPIFGMELKRRIQQEKVKLKPRTMAAEGNTVRFSDNSIIQVKNIIWATGFRADFSWIKVSGVIDEHTGLPLHDRGVTSQKGLYFIGLPWQSSRGSALITGVGRDAEYLLRYITAS